MDRNILYELCQDCKYAERSFGGRAIGCLVEAPQINEGTSNCSSFRYWWTKPPERHWGKSTLIGIGMMLLGVPMFILGVVKFLGWIAPKVNRDNLDLYLPRYRSRK